MTLDDFINTDNAWPDWATGFRVGVRGKAIWTTAHYPDGCSGRLVYVSRIVHEEDGTYARVAYLPYDTTIQFVRKETP